MQKINGNQCEAAAAAAAKDDFLKQQKPPTVDLHRSSRRPVLLRPRPTTSYHRINPFGRVALIGEVDLMMMMVPLKDDKRFPEYRYRSWACLLLVSIERPRADYPILNPCKIPYRAEPTRDQNNSESNRSCPQKCVTLLEILRI